MSSNDATQAVALPIDGRAIASELRALGVTHVICVPDTNLKTVISDLHTPGSPRMIYACTEDEAMGINAGLYITGHRPMLLIQNNGLLACINTILKFHTYSPFKKDPRWAFNKFRQNGGKNHINKKNYC